MNQIEIVVQGILTADGAILLDEKPNLPPGRVIITLRQDIAAKKAEPPGQAFFQMMEEIWAGQRARGHVPRTVEEIEAERQALRDEVESEIEAAIRLQENCRRPQATGETPQL